MTTYLFIRNWSEVWAFFIPLAVVWFSKKRAGNNFRPVIYYLHVGLVLNAISTTMYVYHHQLPHFFYNNNIIYNIHSVVRVIFFSWFLYKTNAFSSDRLFKGILIIYAALTLVNFLFFQSVLNFSPPLLLGETILLIAFCTSYFYHAILDDDTSWMNRPSFLLAAGLLFFEMLNFFVYLFYTPVGDQLNITIKRSIWTVHNFSLVGLCIVIAIALKRNMNQKINPDE